MRLVTDSINKAYCASGWFVRMENNSCGGRRGGGGSPEERLREAGEETAGGGSLQGAGSGRPH